jgi:hypothetical protein
MYVSERWLVIPNHSKRPSGKQTWLVSKSIVSHFTHQTKVKIVVLRSRMILMRIRYSRKINLSGPTPFAPCSLSLSLLLLHVRIFFKSVFKIFFILTFKIELVWIIEENYCLIFYCTRKCCKYSSRRLQQNESALCDSESATIGILVKFHQLFTECSSPSSNPAS